MKRLSLALASILLASTSLHSMNIGSYLNNVQQSIVQLTNAISGASQGSGGGGTSITTPVSSKPIVSNQQTFGIYLWHFDNKETSDLLSPIFSFYDAFQIEGDLQSSQKKSFDEIIKNVRAWGYKPTSLTLSNFYTKNNRVYADVTITHPGAKSIDIPGMSVGWQLFKKESVTIPLQTIQITLDGKEQVMQIFPLSPSSPPPVAPTGSVAPKSTTPVVSEETKYVSSIKIFAQADTMFSNLKSYQTDLVNFLKSKIGPFTITREVISPEPVQILNITISEESFRSTHDNVLSEVKNFLNDIGVTKKLIAELGMSEGTIKATISYNTVDITRFNNKKNYFEDNLRLAAETKVVTTLQRHEINLITMKGDYSAVKIALQREIETINPTIPQVTPQWFAEIKYTNGETKTVRFSL